MYWSNAVLLRDAASVEDYLHDRDKAELCRSMISDICP